MFGYKLDKVVKDIVSTHRENVALSRQVLEMDNLIKASILFMSSFWVAVFKGGGGGCGHLTALSIQDAVFTQKLLEEMKNERNSPLRFFLRMASNPFFYISKWFGLYMQCLRLPGSNQGTLELASRTNEGLHHLIDYKAQELSELTARLAALQGAFLHAVSEHGCEIPFSFHDRNVKAINNLTKYLDRHGFGDTHLKLEISPKELLDMGIPMDDILEFVADLTLMQDRESYDALKAAMDEGRMPEFVRKHIEEKRSNAGE